MNIHGGNIDEALIDFSVNINVLPLDCAIKDAIINAIGSIDKYPEIIGESAIKSIANKHNIHPDELILGNGVTELIYLYARTFKPEKVFIINPCFTEYERAFTLSRSKIYHYINTSQNQFQIDIQNLMTKIKAFNPDVLVLCNPNNPTGYYESYEKLEPVLSYCTNNKTTVFIDESFIDFTGKDSAIKKVNDYNVFIVKSMTKFYSIPGLRLGYAVGNKKTIKEMYHYKEPWTVNNIALNILPLLVNNDCRILNTLAFLKKERNAINSMLTDFEQINTFKSYTNFYLIHHPNSNAKILNQHLNEKGFHLRTCDDFHGLDEHYSRIAILDKDKNQSLLTELMKIISITGGKI